MPRTYDFEAKKPDEVLENYDESKSTLKLINKSLRLPRDVNLNVLSKKLRIKAIEEAISWPKGKDNKHQIETILYNLGEFKLGVAKPGKEAAPDYRQTKKFETGEKTNNPNDMLPIIKEGDKKHEKNLSFNDIFEKLEHLMRADIFGLELMGMLLFRAAFMLDHLQKKNAIRYNPSEVILQLLEERIPLINGMPIRVFLHFVEILSLNEDVKYKTLGYPLKDYGRINTILTCVHLIAVLLNRRSLVKFAGSLARVPPGIAPYPKTKIIEAFPLMATNLF